MFRYQKFPPFGTVRLPIPQKKNRHDTIGRNGSFAYALSSRLFAPGRRAEGTLPLSSLSVVYVTIRFHSSVILLFGVSEHDAKVAL